MQDAAFCGLVSSLLKSAELDSCVFFFASGNQFARFFDERFHILLDAQVVCCALAVFAQIFDRGFLIWHRCSL